MNYQYPIEYIEQIKIIMKLNADLFIEIDVASEYLDMKQATDFVMKVESKNIAVRLRESTCKFRDLTIRSINKTYKTEMDKLKEGFGDIYLYGWLNQGFIKEYMILDIHEIRKSGLLESERKDIPNGDGTFFRTYSIKELKENNCILQKELEDHITIL